jgi:hypothetical protein
MLGFCAELETEVGSELNTQAHTQYCSQQMMPYTHSHVLCLGLRLSHAFGFMFSMHSSVYITSIFTCSPVHYVTIYSSTVLVQCPW